MKYPLGCDFHGNKMRSPESITDLLEFGLGYPQLFVQSKPLSGLTIKVLSDSLQNNIF